MVVSGRAPEAQKSLKLFWDSFFESAKLFSLVTSSLCLSASIKAIWTDNLPGAAAQWLSTSLFSFRSVHSLLDFPKKCSSFLVGQTCPPRQAAIYQKSHGLFYADQFHT